MIDAIPIVACSPDHPIWATQSIQVIVALRADQFVSEPGPHQRTAGRRRSDPYPFDATHNLGGIPTRPVGKANPADRQKARIACAEQRQCVLSPNNREDDSGSIFR